MKTVFSCCWWTTRITTSSPIHVAKARLEADDFQLGRTDYPALLPRIIVPPNHPGMQSGGSTISVFKKFAARGLEQLEIERAIATAEDKDSDDRSGRTATSPPLDASDCESILLLRRTARRVPNVISTSSETSTACSHNNVVLRPRLARPVNPALFSKKIKYLCSCAAHGCTRTSVSRS
ncbi:hypothetical protein B0H14DRAFT_491761 [Mycena olivaceomarginata]|nr:hypothetical protein B0H14DRAFT_491761 [Mycena olivaceomarginata]